MTFIKLLQIFFLVGIIICPKNADARDKKSKKTVAQNVDATSNKDKVKATAPKNNTAKKPLEKKEPQNANATLIKRKRIALTPKDTTHVNGKEPISVTKKYNTAAIITKDTVDPQITEANRLKQEALQTRMNKAFRGLDTSRIVKNAKRFNPKVQAKSVEDPNALVFNNFYVSPNLYGKHADIIFEYVKNYHKNFGARMGRIKAANKGYFAMIDATLKRNTIPKEFHSLAVIESGLNPNAVSPVGAVGPWQFMEPTAELLGLVVDETIDERRDFIKSTNAAARFCKRLHNIFHDWLLVVAAYNCGPAPVIRNLAKTGGKSFWDIKHLLPKETQNHVMAFIATSLYYDKNSKVLDFGNLPKEAKPANFTNEVLTKNKPALIKPFKNNNAITKKQDDEEDDMEVPDENAKIIDEYKPIFYEDEAKEVLTLKIKGQYNLEVIGTILDVEVSNLRRWNPKFNEQAWANNNQIKLTIPSNKLDAFLIKKDKILQECVKNPHPTTPSLQDKNNNKEKVATNPKPNASLKQEVSSKIEKKTYIVKRGDKLIEIAETFGLTVTRLMELNQLTTMNVKPGHTLYLE